MPLQYSGTLAEHRAVRAGCGIFDVSHLGRFELAGTGANELISRLLCNDPARIGHGEAQYTMMLTPEGGVIDDIIIWWLADERLIVLPNGANHDIVMSTFAAEAGTEVSVTDLRAESVLLAIQGPNAPAILETVLGSKPGRFQLLEHLGPDGSVIAAGTGYTGEPGAEILVAADAGRDAFERFLDAGAEPAGLGARDTLRLEMGYALWGQDLDRTVSPLEAGLGWVVGWNHEFVGKDALIAQRDKGVSKQLIAFTFDGRTIPRPGHQIRCGVSQGSVTSGNFSPGLEVGIGMGYLTPPPSAAATTLDVEIRGNWRSATITDTPFIER